MRNVSERRRLDDQSRDLYQQLLQAEKMAALGQTISGVAHELNNPLATILSWAERLAERNLDETSRRGIDVILGESERAARIVRNLLTFARKRQSTRSMIDLNQVVRETLALRAYEQRLTNIDVVTALASGLPPVFADPHQIQQVLLNLVINAEQAMLSANGRGSLVLRTWHDVERNAVVLQVSDDGPGVPADVKNKIFDPFFTTKEVGKGTGLGLDRRLRHRPGARRQHSRRLADGRWRVIHRGVPGEQRRERRAAADVRGRTPTTRCTVRRCCWLRMNGRWRRPSSKR